MSQYNIELIYQFEKKNQRTNILFQKKQDILLEENKKVLRKEFQILKLNYQKNNNKKKIKQIMIIKMDLIFIIRKIIRYYKKNKSFL